MIVGVWGVAGCNILDPRIIFADAKRRIMVKMMALGAE